MEKKIYGRYFTLSPKCETANFVFINKTVDKEALCDNTQRLFFTNNYRKLLSDDKYYGALFWNKKQTQYRLYKKATWKEVIIQTIWSIYREFLMIKKNLFKIISISLFLLLSLLFLGLLLVFQLSSWKIPLQKNLSDFTSDVFTIMNNSASVIDSILKESQNYPEDIKKNPLLQQTLEENLKILITPNIKYAYLLYRDERGVFRFLADASKLEEGFSWSKKFDVDSPEWLQIYTDKKPLAIRHGALVTAFTELFSAYLRHENVEFILAIDFSMNKIEEINNIIHLIQNGILAIMLVVLII